MKKLQKQTRKEDSKVCSYGYDIWSGDGELMVSDQYNSCPYKWGLPSRYSGCWVETF